MKKSLLALALTVALAATSQAFTLAKTDNAKLTLGGLGLSRHHAEFNHTWVGQKGADGKYTYTKLAKKGVEYSGPQLLRLELKGSVTGQNGWNAEAAARFQTSYSLSGSKLFDSSFDSTKYLEEAKANEELGKKSFEASGSFGKPGLQRAYFTVGNDKLGSLRFARGSWDVVDELSSDFGVNQTVGATRFQVSGASLTYKSPVFNNTSVALSVSKDKDNNVGLAGFVSYENGDHAFQSTATYTVDKAERSLDALYTLSNLGGVKGLSLSAGAGVAAGETEKNATVYGGFGYELNSYLTLNLGGAAQYVAGTEPAEQTVETEYYATKEEVKFDDEVKTKLNTAHPRFTFTGPADKKNEVAYRVTGTGKGELATGKQYQGYLGATGTLYSGHGLTFAYALDYLFTFADLTSAKKADGFKYTLEQTTKAADADVDAVKANKDAEWKAVETPAVATKAEYTKEAQELKTHGFTHSVRAQLVVLF